ncbi:MAG: ribonuclease E activity regulator RraA [Bacteroidetes bacterium]|nr:ribonuclease E activity regulator RraA [Bacteroidota bacterium]
MAPVNKTTDLSDQFPAQVQVALPIGLRHFGRKKNFSGKMVTLKCFEDNSFVRKLLETDGAGQVLVVDGGGSKRCALLGDLLAALAIKNNWSGVVVYGCIRDSAAIADMELGVMALDTIPLKSNKRNEGQENIALSFAGITFTTGQYLYADEDGILVSENALSL